MKTHTDLINLIAIKIKAKTYLEIGVYNPDHNFNLIAIQSKVSVDPDNNAGAMIKMTSDDYFKTFPEKKYDLIFIDGLHHADQVKRDIENSFNCLTENGVIVLHDCNPPTEKTTCVPRGEQREWCGDVYRTICQIESEKFTVDFDYGCCVIRDKVAFSDAVITWEQFNANRKELLNLITVEEAQELISKW